MIARAELKQKKITVKFDVRPISGSVRRYYIAFKKEHFVPELKRYKLTIPHDVHMLGERYTVDKITRVESDKGEGNISHQYKILINGDFILLSDEPIDGYLLISEF